MEKILHLVWKAKNQGKHRFFIKKWYNEGYEISTIIWDLGGTLLDNYETSQQLL